MATVHFGNTQNHMRWAQTVDNQRSNGRTRARVVGDNKTIRGGESQTTHIPYIHRTSRERTRRPTRLATSHTLSTPYPSCDPSFKSSGQTCPIGKDNITSTKADQERGRGDEANKRSEGGGSCVDCVVFMSCLVRLRPPRYSIRSAFVLGYVHLPQTYITPPGMLRPTSIAQKISRWFRAIGNYVYQRERGSTRVISYIAAIKHCYTWQIPKTLRCTHVRTVARNAFPAYQSTEEVGIKG